MTRASELPRHASPPRPIPISHPRPRPDLRHRGGKQPGGCGHDGTGGESGSLNPLRAADNVARVFGRDRDVQKIMGRVVASKEWRHHGESAAFTITQWKYVVEYTVPGGEPKRVELKQAMGFNALKMKNPGVGAKVPLLLHHSGKVEFDLDDPRIAIKPDGATTERKRQKSAYKKALDGD